MFIYSKTKTTFPIIAPSQASDRFSNPITALLVPVDLNGFPLGYAHPNWFQLFSKPQREKEGNFIQMAVIIEMLEKLKCFIIWQPLFICSQRSLEKKKEKKKYLLLHSVGQKNNREEKTNHKWVKVRSHLREQTHTHHVQGGSVQGKIKILKIDLTNASFLWHAAETAQRVLYRAQSMENVRAESRGSAEAQKNDFKSQVDGALKTYVFLTIATVW